MIIVSLLKASTQAGMHPEKDVLPWLLAVFDHRCMWSRTAVLKLGMLNFQTGVCRSRWCGGYLGCSCVFSSSKNKIRRMRRSCLEFGNTFLHITILHAHTSFSAYSILIYDWQCVLPIKLHVKQSSQRKSESTWSHVLHVYHMYTCPHEIWPLLVECLSLQNRNLSFNRWSVLTWMVLQSVLLSIWKHVTSINSQHSHPELRQTISWPSFWGHCQRDLNAWSLRSCLMPHVSVLHTPYLQDQRSTMKTWERLLHKRSHIHN